MSVYIHNRRSHLSYRILSGIIAFSFLCNVVLPPQVVSAQMIPAVLNLPAVGAMVPLSSGFVPTMVTGITVHPENPLAFDFIIGTGDETLDDAAFKEESRKLIKYFLATLTVPNQELWVNLSPYEKDRIVPQSFGDTEMGRDMLAQDYILKQLSASLMYPEDELGKKFWDRVYTKAYQKYGTSEIPMNTFNKIWIVPQEAVVYEHGNSAFVIKSHLKVMLEEDYIALQNNMGITKYGLDSLNKEDAEVISGVTSEVVKEVLIPEIEREVNEGETFANLRQIYNSVILATWYEQNLKGSLLGQLYVDRAKTKGIDNEDKEVNQKIYDQYVEAFKKGVYNYIKEDLDLQTQEVVPRKYFSGGATAANVEDVLTTIKSSSPVAQRYAGDVDRVVSSPVKSVGVRLADVGNRAKAPNVARAVADAEKAIGSEKREAIKRFIAQALGVSEKDLRNERPLDALDVETIATAVEKELGVEVTVSDEDWMRTVGGAIALLSGKKFDATSSPIEILSIGEKKAVEIVKGKISRERGRKKVWENAVYTMPKSDLASLVNRIENDKAKVYRAEDGSEIDIRRATITPGTVLVRVPIYTERDGDLRDDRYVVFGVVSSPVVEGGIELSGERARIIKEHVQAVRANKLSNELVDQRFLNAVEEAVGEQFENTLSALREAWPSRPDFEFLSYLIQKTGSNAPEALQKLKDLDETLARTGQQNIVNKAFLRDLVESRGPDQVARLFTEIEIRIDNGRVLKRQDILNFLSGGAAASPVISRQERVTQIKRLVSEIDKELAVRGAGDLPEVAVLSDFHGGLNRFIMLLSDVLNKFSGFKGQLDPNRPIEEQLAAQGLSFKDIKGQIILGGDILDRGKHGIKIFLLIKELVEKSEGKVVYVTGNHDFWAFANLLGLHLPWYEGFHFYNDTAAERFIATQRRTNPELFDTPESVLWWTQRLAEHNADQDAYQKKAFDGKVKEVRARFIEDYKTYHKNWTDQQKDAMEKFIGYFARIGVTDPYVGLNGLGKASASWWEEVVHQLNQGHEARRSLGAEDAELSVWQEAAALAQKISQEVGGRLDQALTEGKWWYQIFEAINTHAYRSVEWSAKDWSSHKGWGDSVIGEINEMIDAGLIQEEKLDQKNYIQSPTLQALARFYRDNFNLYAFTPYGDLFSHGGFPVNSDGSINVFYKGIDYKGRDVFKGLDAVSRDVKDNGKSLKEIWEALHLVNTWYADATTELKPNYIKRNIDEIGIEKINKGIGVRHHVTGHNPIALGKLAGRAFMAGDNGYTHAFADFGMSEKYGGQGGWVRMSSGGVNLRGFESEISDDLVDSPRTHVWDKETGAIKKTIENPGLEGKAFLTGAKEQLSAELARLSLSSVEKRHNEVHVPNLQALIGEVGGQLRALMDEYEAAVRARDSEEVKNLDGKINVLIDRVNVNRDLERLSREGKLTRAQTLTVAEFKSLDQGRIYAEYIQKVKTAILNGDYVPQFLFAGKATRLKRGEMYPLDIWAIAMEEGVVTREEVDEYRYGIGPRQLIAYMGLVKKLAMQEGVDVGKALNKQRAMIHINDAVESVVLNDLKKNDYYDFDIANLYFINQPEFKGYDFVIERGSVRLIRDEKSGSLVFGHGDNATQLAVEGDTYQITSSGEKSFLEKDFLAEMGKRFIASHRINDMTKMSIDTVVDIEKVAMGMYLQDRGHRIVADLVDNPGKQKGGTGTNLGLLETIAAKGSKELTALIDAWAKEGAPYNAFRLLYRADTLKMLLEENKLRYYLRFKDGRFYLEAVTGDLTQFPNSNTAFIIREGEEIKDFKEVKNLRMAVEFLKKQGEELRKGADIKTEGKVSSPIQKLTDEKVGGINLNPELLDLQIKRDGNGVPLPLLQQPVGHMRIEGFVPIIINVAPVTNLPMLLGLGDDGLPVDSADADMSSVPMELGLIEKYRNKYIRAYTAADEEV